MSVEIGRRRRDKGIKIQLYASFSSKYDFRFRLSNLPIFFSLILSRKYNHCIYKEVAIYIVGLIYATHP